MAYNVSYGSQGFCDPTLLATMPLVQEPPTSNGLGLGLYSSCFQVEAAYPWHIPTPPIAPSTPINVPHGMFKFSQYASDAYTVPAYGSNAPHVPAGQGSASTSSASSVPWTPSNAAAPVFTPGATQQTGHYASSTPNTAHAHAPHLYQHHLPSGPPGHPSRSPPPPTSTPTFTPTSTPTSTSTPTLSPDPTRQRAVYLGYVSSAQHERCPMPGCPAALSGSAGAWRAHFRTHHHRDFCRVPACRGGTRCRTKARCPFPDACQDAPGTIDSLGRHLLAVHVGAVHRCPTCGLEKVWRSDSCKRHVERCGRKGVEEAEKEKGPRRAKNAKA
ncbi:hypothetical protein BD309DRAFT_875829 [Dichomitus squalens]|uniref:Uncharacterized protein n=1 Tax=Dichomitus squalens TaxID=114155 RepID=A0A4Q9NBL0_9APHY|nr:hypothetical protein BD309DRAFT_875829 [Dichomitus squalens]TBU64243.1 hypothetical protein BD310DRAFT_972673 [Dichomitus squalens]